MREVRARQPHTGPHQSLRSVSALCVWPPRSLIAAMPHPSPCKDIGRCKTSAQDVVCSLAPFAAHVVFENVTSCQSAIAYHRHGTSSGS